MKRIACIICVIATPVLGQFSFEDYDPSILQTCLAQNETQGDQSSCIGLGAASCLEGEAGKSTVGYGACMSAEWQDWDDRLNEIYSVVLQQQRTFGEDLKAHNPAFPNPDEVMRDMQRAWISYRDLACEWEYLQWSGGTGAGPASAECMMRLTAEQVLFLEARAH